jgi:hypothetical protein
MNWPRAAAKTRDILTDAFATNLRRHPDQLLAKAARPSRRS